MSTVLEMLAEVDKQLTLRNGEVFIRAYNDAGIWAWCKQIQDYCTKWPQLDYTYSCNSKWFKYWRPAFGDGFMGEIQC